MESAISFAKQILSETGTSNESRKHAQLETANKFSSSIAWAAVSHALHRLEQTQK